MNTQKLKTLEVGRGVAAALVVAYHAVEIVTRTGGGVPNSLFRFGYAGVDFFFVLSGFIIYYIHAADIGCPGRLKSYLYKRFVRVYPVYWIVMAALIAAMLVAPSITDSYKQSIGFVSQSLFLVPQDRPPLLGVTWSLCYEQAFYLLFGLAILHKRAGLAAAGAVAIVSAADLFVDAAFPLVFFCNAHILEFFLGIGVAVAVKRTRPSTSMRPLLTLAILAFASVGMIDAFFQKLSLEGSVAGYGIPSAFIVYTAVCAERQKAFHIPWVWQMMGAASYSVYLVHWPAVLVLSRILAKLNLDPNVTWVTVTTFGLIAGVVFHICVENPILKLLSSRRAVQAKPPAGSFTARALDVSY